MSDTYEFLKAQKDAIVAKQDAEQAEWLTAASEDIAHYRKQLAEAKAEIERLQAERDEAMAALKGVVASWDNHTFQQERHVVDAEMGSYWSPSGAMVDAECIANARAAIAKGAEK